MTAGKKSLPLSVRNLDSTNYISGNHFLQPSEGEILDIKDLSLLAGPEREKALKNHFAAICRAIESGVFAFIAHVDYIRKSEFCPDEAFWQEKMKVVDCLENAKRQPN